VTRIAAIGNLSRDVVAGGAPRIGGGVYYSARALAHLGADAHVAAAAAERHERELLRPLEALGLPVRWYVSRDTTAYSIEYDGERRTMLQTAVGDPWDPEQALEAVADARWVHVGALTRTDFAEPTLAALAAEARTLLVDAQGLVRRATIGPLETDAEIGDVLRHVTILKLDDEEAETLAGTSDPRALRSLDVPEVILTLGSRGAFVVTPRLVEHVPAREAAGVLDPTGAGDTFAAAYLASRAEGAEPPEAARHAAALVASFLNRE
jgi:sugar/nucleoside kinase (ribokinase family)